MPSGGERVGFMDSLKNATSGLVENVRHKEFGLKAGELAEKWEVLSRYGPEIKVKTKEGARWWELKKVYWTEKEVGLFRRSRVMRVILEYIVRHEEDEEERGWFEYRPDSETAKMEKSPGEKVKIRLSLASYKKMVEREGEIL